MTRKDTTGQTVSDADLVLRTRAGETDAFGELWRRHHPSGISAARSVTSSIDSEELVHESYARIYQAIRKGGGPNGSFRAYLFTSIRNTAAAWGRAQRDMTAEAPGTAADPAPVPAPVAADAVDRGLIAQAFRSLPSRWQEVLWYTEVEQTKPADVSPLLGLTAGAVSQLNVQAREGLREAWIQAHLRGTDPESECHWAIENLGAHVRGNLSARSRRRMDDHLAICERCPVIAAEARDVADHLAAVLLPLVLGTSGAGAYVASLQSGSVADAAVAAMPSSVLEGAAIPTESFGPPAFGGAAALASTTTDDGATAALDASGSTTTSSRFPGPISGIGAMVVISCAALVTAGIVAAAAAVPSILSEATATSRPSAADTDSSSISSDVAADDSMGAHAPADITVVEEQPDTPPAPDTRTEPGTRPAPSAPPAPPVVPSPPASRPAVAAPAPHPSPSPSPTTTPAPSPTPSPSASPSASPTPDPEPSEPATEEPAPEKPAPGQETGETTSLPPSAGSSAE